MEDETITLLSVDQEEFKVPRPVAEESKTIASIIADTSADAPVPLPNVKASILRKVIAFCQFNVDTQAKEGEKSSKSQEDIKAFRKAFVEVDNPTLFDLILAANYLNISSLLDITCQAVAEQIKGKTPEQIRERFNIENDFTPEEEEQVRRENQWAFD